MKVAIVGFSGEGQATLRYLRRLQEYDSRSRPMEITVCDQDADLQLPDGVDSRLGETYLQGLDRFDRIYRTPGLRPNKLIAANPGLDESAITTMTNEFFRVCPTSNIIGVTGTKGKGTTTTLIARMLEATGERVHVGGNIGTPVLDLLPHVQESDWVVLELSSFQLFDARYSPHIGVCLMIALDHLDWHADMEEYVTAKSRIFSWQSASDIAVYNADNDNAVRIAGKTPGRMIGYSVRGPADVRVEKGVVHAGDQRIIEVSGIGLRGPHNQENVCAAIGAAIAALQEPGGSGDFGAYLSPDAKENLAAVIRDFHGLEHRLQYVTTKQGVSFYDDSFSTNPMPTMAAIHSFSEPQILILGGSSKDAEFDELAREIAKGNVKHAVLIGDEAARLQGALDGAGFSAYSYANGPMGTIVEEARRHAEPGDVVLLSPACASFGLFSDYKDRGRQFATAVQELGEE